MKKQLTSPLLNIALILLISVGILFLIHFALPRSSGTWLEVGGTRYYHNADGEPVTGWQEIDGGHYYFTTYGAMLTGWQKIDSEHYYFFEDGTLALGWQHIDGKRYYFTESGVMLSGWQEVDGQTRYFHPDGALAAGMTALDGKQYLFSDDGVAFTGFVQLNETKYLFLPDGTMAFGWVDYNGQRYLAGEDGSICTGWVTLGEYKYYFHPDGVMATGENLIDGKQYFFTPKGIHVTLVNPWHSIPDGYQVDLAAVDKVYAVDRICLDALQRMLADCAATGHEGIICSAYRSQADQEWLYDRKVNYYLEQGLIDDTAKELAGRSVAVPGTSEHQLGLAVDIVSTDYYVLDETQATTKVQQWLMEHCWEYGFILRYPVGTTDITGIIYEPWHYRYVGTEVSLELRDLGITLEEYLGAVTYD